MSIENSTEDFQTLNLNMSKEDSLYQENKNLKLVKKKLVPFLSKKDRFQY